MSSEPDWGSVADDILCSPTPYGDAVAALYNAYALGKSHATEWRPIADAPRDGSFMLLLMGKYITIGRWNDDQHAKKPKPYWDTERGYLFGKQFHKDHPATHYMPLPPAPEPKS